MKYWFWANIRYPVVELQLISRYNFSNWQQGVLNWLVACHMTEPACLLMNRVQWFHDDVIKWKRFPRHWPSVRGIHWSRVDSPHKGQWRGALIFYLICTWTNSWVNNRDTGDLRRHRAHYGVTVMPTATRYTCAINLSKVTDATNSKCNSLCHSVLELISLHWRHNDQDGVSNHQPHGCLLNRLFRRRSKKTSKLHVTGLCVGNSPGPVNSPHKGPVTRKMFPFGDVIMILQRPLQLK